MAVAGSAHRHRPRRILEGRETMVVQKTPDEIEMMARAGEILAAVHEVLR